jgi:hypothetical protein
MLLYGPTAYSAQGSTYTQQTLGGAAWPGRGTHRTLYNSASEVARRWSERAFGCDEQLIRSWIEQGAANNLNDPHPLSG